jgi:DNA-binding transcriptional regulator YiaG
MGVVMYKLKRCHACKSNALVDTDHADELQLGPYTFATAVAAQRCTACDEVTLSGAQLEHLDAAIVGSIVQNGLWCPETFKYCRKNAGLRAVDLAELLGVAAETLSRWENGHQPIDRNAYALLGGLVADHLAGRKETAERLHAMAHPPKKRQKRYQVRAA